MNQLVWIGTIFVATTYLITNISNTTNAYGCRSSSSSTNHTAGANETSGNITKSTLDDSRQISIVQVMFKPCHSATGTIVGSDSVKWARNESFQLNFPHCTGTDLTSSDHITLSTPSICFIFSLMLNKSSVLLNMQIHKMSFPPVTSETKVMPLMWDIFCATGDRDVVVSRPIIFEGILKRLVGEDSGDRVIDSHEEFIERMLFNEVTLTEWWIMTICNFLSNHSNL